ncbi:MAG: hypothetical protein VW840_21070, partial [Gammaproteobacteria bacterium]
AATIANQPDAEIIIDLEALQVICANEIYPVTMKQSTREAFLAATYDPLDNLLSAEADIRQTAARLGYA